MPDPFDLASDHEQNLRADAIAAHQRRAAAQAAERGTHSARECESCDEPIPEQRRQAVPGVRHCVGCQARIEKGLFR